jgi:hypothetical protein
VFALDFSRAAPGYTSDARPRRKEGSMKLRIAVAAVSSVALLLCGTAAAATPYGNGWAIPLEADTPSWFTPELAARVHAAGDLTHLVVDTNWVPSFIAGTRISKIQSIAGGWSFVSSPLCL